LSLALGMEFTAFKDQQPTYWSPSYYHYAYGRLRLTRGYETGPFEPTRPAPATWRDRFGYLAEVTAGINNDGKPEVSERAGLAWHATNALTFQTEFFHLDSQGRFSDSDYAENRLDLRGEVWF
jgi:hypothetical protein